MQGAALHSPSNYSEENDGAEKQKEKATKLREKEVGTDIDELTGRFQRMNVTKRETSKRGQENEKREGTCHETVHFSGSPDTCLSFTNCSQKQRKFPCKEADSELSWANHGFWRQEQRSRAAKLQKQLKARRELELLIEEQLNRFHAQYNRAMVPHYLENVAKLLMPQWAAPQELATLSWLGDWRPSAILELLHCLTPSFSSNSTASEQALSQLIYEISVEEAVIDEEMAEIQATCVYYLPFAPSNSSKSGGSGLQGIRAEFKKIAQVIAKAQKLRFKALELLVEKVLNQTDAAEFLVAFSGIQDAIHQFGENQRLRKGPVSLSVKPQDVVETSKQLKIHLEDRISLWEMTSLRSEEERSIKGTQGAIQQFEEQHRLQKGPVTLPVKSQDVIETAKQPNICLKQRTSLGENTSSILDEKGGLGILGAIQEFEEQQGLRKGPAMPSAKFEDVVGISNQPNIHIDYRTRFREERSRCLELMKRKKGIQETINEIKEQLQQVSLFAKFRDLVETSKPPDSS